jgi:hypothetical protein
MKTNVIDSFSELAPVAPPTSAASPHGSKLIAREQKLVSRQVRKSEHNDKALKSSMGSDSMGLDSMGLDSSSLGDSMGSGSSLLWFTEKKDQALKSMMQKREHALVQSLAAELELPTLAKTPVPAAPLEPAYEQPHNHPIIQETGHNFARLLDNKITNSENEANSTLAGTKKEVDTKFESLKARVDAKIDREEHGFTSPTPIHASYNEASAENAKLAHDKKELESDEALHRLANLPAPKILATPTEAPAAQLPKTAIKKIESQEKARVEGTKSQEKNLDTQQKRSEQILKANQKGLEKLVNQKVDQQHAALDAKKKVMDHEIDTRRKETDQAKKNLEVGLKKSEKATDLKKKEIEKKENDRKDALEKQRDEKQHQIGEEKKQREQALRKQKDQRQHSLDDMKKQEEQRQHQLDEEKKQKQQALEKQKDQRAHQLDNEKKQGEEMKQEVKKGEEEAKHHKEEEANHHKEEAKSVQVTSKKMEGYKNQEQAAMASAEKQEQANKLALENMVRPGQHHDTAAAHSQDEAHKHDEDNEHEKCLNGVMKAMGNHLHNLIHGHDHDESHDESHDHDHDLHDMMKAPSAPQFAPKASHAAPVASASDKLKIMAQIPECSNLLNSIKSHIASLKFTAESTKTKTGLTDWFVNQAIDSGLEKALLKPSSTSLLMGKNQKYGHGEDFDTATTVDKLSSEINSALTDPIHAVPLVTYDKNFEPIGTVQTKGLEKTTHFANEFASHSYLRTKGPNYPKA